ncbi:uncharacterized protein N7473_007746 [Penicillium subrubescens]|uniref:uncharacterized protein n=1 Tax=Penicillium subrubescens TaxID=1316194 RepID=UPI0025457817|nr:uncharacterized protein N7473_007746 [Penicillium subrubescens]KAJ5891518.1 hypothetical protein N7473_007746 [Penicillium subrubescens]
MGGLTTPAIIVIVLVGCLAITALGAALFRHYRPLEEEARYSASYEQGQYMRTVRMRNYGHLKQESLGPARDLESRYTADEVSSHYNPHPYTPRTPRE